MFRLSLIAVLILTVLAACAAAGASSDIWGDAIMKQPFDKQPFHEIKVPKWVEDLQVVCYGLPAIGSKAYTDELKVGVEAGCIFFAGPTFACYPSKYLKVTDPTQLAQLPKDIAAYKEAGIRIIAVIPPALLGEVYFAHPEWRRVEHRNDPIPCVDQKSVPWGGPLCMTGPWGDHMIDILVEIVTNYPEVSAWSFDGLHDYGCCYCRSCRDAYRKDTGLEIPDANMDDSAFRHYQHWLDRRMEDVIVRLQTRIKSVNPDVALITWTTNAGRFGHFLSIPRNMPTRMNLLFDCPDQEFWMDETNRGNSVVGAFANAYIWAVTNHRSASSCPYLMSHGNPYDGSSFPKQEYLRRELLALTYGTKISTDPTPDIRSRTPWLTNKEPEPWAAMVMSDNTNCFYGRDPKRDETRYLSNVFGCFRTGIEEHFPMTVINDWNLNFKDLSKYKVLVLPNTAVMNEEQAEGIRQFVKNGGGLVASVDTSLFDEFGDARKDFLLADVFGVHYKGAAAGSGQKDELDPNFAKTVDASYWEKHKSIFDVRIVKHPMLDSEKMTEYLPANTACFKGQAVAVSADADAAVIGTITSRDTGAQPVPGVVVRNYGKGKVVYLAAGLDSAYYLYPYPYQGLMLAQAIRWVAPEQPSIVVDAPKCVHATFCRQKKQGERLIVQLYNDLNSTGNHAKPDDDVPLRDEIVPIDDIKVTFKDYKISRVHLEPGGTDLKVTKTKDGAQVTVPKLAIHGIVVAELTAAM